MGYRAYVHFHQEENTIVLSEFQKGFQSINQQLRTTNTLYNSYTPSILVIDINFLVAKIILFHLGMSSLWGNFYAVIYLFSKKTNRKNHRDRKSSSQLNMKTSINWSWWHLFPFCHPPFLHSLHLSSFILKGSLLLFLPQGQLPCDLPEVRHRYEKLYCSTACPSHFVSTLKSHSGNSKERSGLALAGYHKVHHSLILSPRSHKRGGIL